MKIEFFIGYPIRGSFDLITDDLSCLVQGSKRVHSGMSESFNQAGAVINPSTSDYGSIEVNNSAIIGGSNHPVGWGWDDDDRGMGMDIQALLSEFGDFGDLFEDDVLPFGEVILVLKQQRKLVLTFKIISTNRKHIQDLDSALIFSVPVYDV